MAKGYLIGDAFKDKIKSTIARVDGWIDGSDVTKIETRFESTVPSSFSQIRNDSDVDVPARGVLVVSGVSNLPSGGTLNGTDYDSYLLRAFAARPTLTGIKPSLNSSQDVFVICIDEIKVGEIGRIVAGGLIACRVNVTSGLHGFASVKHDDVTQLESVECGAMRILWKQSGLGQYKWAVGVM
jgi:hypothetical protein